MLDKDWKCLTEGEEKNIDRAVHFSEQRRPKWGRGFTIVIQEVESAITLIMCPLNS